MSRATIKALPMGMDQVQVSLVSEDGRSITARFDGAYLRAKCWGILADIDPDGLMEAALGQRIAPLRSQIIGIPINSQVILALVDGPLSNQGLRNAIGDGSISAHRINSRCQDLKRGGLIRRADKNGGPGCKAIYELTDAGLERALELEPAQTRRRLEMLRRAA